MAVLATMIPQCWLHIELFHQVYESSRYVELFHSLHIINYVNDAADDARMRMVAVMGTGWVEWVNPYSIPDGDVVNISSLCTFVFWEMVIVS